MKHSDALNLTRPVICWKHLTVFFLLLFGFANQCSAEDEDEDSRAKRKIDATTLHHKVLCGYQGWFRCPGDGTGEGWLHWSRNRQQITSESLTVEMWPDMSDYSESEKYAVPPFTGPDGQPAHLFSSANARTVERHFDWMRQYGIDGVFVQRFLVNLDKPSFVRRCETRHFSGYRCPR